MKNLFVIVISLLFSSSANAQWSKVGSTVAKNFRRTNITGPIAGAAVQSIHRFQDEQKRLAKNYRVPSKSLYTAAMQSAAMQSRMPKITPATIKPVKLFRPEPDSVLKGCKALVVVPDMITAIDITHHEVK